jgi:lysylphosphatidylglycerol synthetase-like protein (DUF2156 family)
VLRLSHGLGAIRTSSTPRDGTPRVPSQPITQGRAATGPSEAESETLALISVRLALAFVGSLDWIVATVRFNLVGSPGGLARMMAAVALISGASLLVLASGLLGPIRRRWTAVVVSLLGPLIVAAYGAWRLLRGSHPSDPGPWIAVAVLAIAAAATLVIALRLDRRAT